METTIQKETEKEQAKLNLQKSLKEALLLLNHIDLTEDEHDNAILQAKLKKDSKLKEEAKQKRIDENRKALTSTKWSFQQMSDFAKYRANKLFETDVFIKPFVVDDANRVVFEILCAYFSEDVRFEAMGFSLSKGICLAGNPGVGKSWLMKLFNQNPRQCYYIRDCKELSLQYQTNGALIISEYSKPIQAAVNDASVFYQRNIGVCLSDLGTEDVKKNYGNESNVVGDILFERYKNNLPGTLTHIETNLNGDDIERMYGLRIRSRIREMFNWIEVKGEDRRK